MAEPVIEELREQLFRASPQEFGVEPEGDVWGVLMETGYGKGFATLVALADGSASLYLSTGSGVIGGGIDPGVNASARRMVRRSQHVARLMNATAEYPLPDPGTVRFYLLTSDGILTAVGGEETLGAGDHGLSDLYHAGHDVITRLRGVASG